jgi:hypothetical protein
MFEHDDSIARRVGAGVASAAALACVAAPAAAQQVVLQGETARLSVAPYGAATTLGGRAELAADLGPLETALSAALERGGGRLGLSDSPAGAVQIPTAWRSKMVRSSANWTLGPGATVTLEAEDSDRWSRSFASLVASRDGQLAHDRSSALRLRADAHVEHLSLQLGAEVTSGNLSARRADLTAEAEQRWLTSRRLFGKLTWRPADAVSIEAGQAFQSFDVGWSGASEISSTSGRLTPSFALALAADRRTRWRFEAERTLTPVQPDQFAAFAQLATPGVGSAPQPDYGWRYSAKVDRELGDLHLTAGASGWRMESVTELGPVGAGEAPVRIGPGARRQLDLGVTTPLRPVGLGATSLAGELSLRRSSVRDPFTGQARAISGEAPYRAQIRLSGALPAVDMNWSLVARTDGPQRLNQMSQVTALGATSGLGGALTYGAGPVAVSLELDNLIGGSRQVTTYSYTGARADQILSDILRRNEESRAVRIALKRRL